MLQLGATNDVGESCTSNATGTSQALRSLKTLQVVAVASRPLSGMMSCLAPSPAVMSSLATSTTRSGLPWTWWIFLVLPSVTSAPSGYFDGRWSGVLASKAKFLFRPRSRGNDEYITRSAAAKPGCAQLSVKRLRCAEGSPGTYSDGGHLSYHP